MNLPEARVHSFIVRIWLESAEPGHEVIWRGHVTHVAEGQRHDIQSLAELETFIARYIRAWDTPAQ